MKSPIPVVLALMVVAQPAWAERPITYREALQAALDANPALQRSMIAREQAKAGVVTAGGAFDPNFSSNGLWRSSPETTFIPGLGNLQFDNRQWSLVNAVSGTAHTGTTLELQQDLFSQEFEQPDFITATTTTTTVTTGGGTNQNSFPVQIPNGTRSDTFFNGGLSVSLTQQLLRGLSFKYNLENVTLARRNLEVADLNLEKMRQDTLAQAAQAYWNWVYQTNLAEIQREAVLVAEEALRVGELKVEAGEQAPVEKTRLQAALVQAQANAIDTENLAEQAANDLLLAMGEAPEQLAIPATPAGEVPTYELDAAKAVAVAMEQNLDLVVARANLDTAQIEKKNAVHGRLPSLAASGELGRVVQNAGTAGEALDYFGDSSDPKYQVSGSLTVPLLNRSARGTARSKAATVDQRQSELSELERSIAAQVEQQVRQLQSSKRKVELADANLALAEQTLAAEEALSSAGRSIQKDVLEARTEVERTRAEAAKARTDYRLAQTELLRLQGQLSPDVP